MPGQKPVRRSNGGVGTPGEQPAAAGGRSMAAPLLPTRPAADPAACLTCG